MYDHAGFTRRKLLTLAAGASAMLAFDAGATSSPPGARRMLTRPIPSTGEALPVVGVGTYRGFDVTPTGTEYQMLPKVLDTLFSAGGTVIDTSPMYGRAEQSIGELLSIRKPRPGAFIATKVWTHGHDAGLAQMEESFRMLQTQRIDLMQIHNLVDWQTHMPTLRKWKEEGRIRYIGITHYTSSAYAEVEAVLKSEQLDFLQINYALDDRAAEARILPLARDRGVAVICNRPFGGGGLLTRLNNTLLPDWAKDVQADNWAQLALKFLLSHPAVTCVIPGTGNPRYMLEDVGAGFGPMLNEAQRRKLIALVK